MRGRLLILVALIILLAALAAVLVLQQQDDDEPPDEGTAQPQVAQVLSTPVPTVQPIPVVIAIQELPRGFRFPDTLAELESEGIVALFPWPQNPPPPFNAITAEDGGLERLLGKITRTDILREQPILTNMLVDNLADVVRAGSDAAAILPPNLVGVSLPVDRLTSVAFAVQDGDRVDVIVSMLFVDVDEAFQSISPNNITLFNVTDEGSIEFTAGFEGRLDSSSFGPIIVGPNERQRPRLVTQRTIQDALVVHVGEFPPGGRFIGVPPTPTPAPDDTARRDGPPPTATPISRPDIITLGVTPQDAVILTWMVEAQLPITLALRSALDTSRVPTEPVTLDFLMNEFRIQLPGRRPFALEPAIRSIRRLVTEDVISLEDSAPPRPAADGG